MIFLLCFLHVNNRTEQIGEDLDQPEKWVPYLSVMQRLARLNSSAVALAISQNGNTNTFLTRLTPAHLPGTQTHTATTLRRWCCHLLVGLHNLIHLHAYRNENNNKRKTFSSHKWGKIDQHVFWHNIWQSFPLRFLMKCFFFFFFLVWYIYIFMFPSVSSWAAKLENEMVEHLSDHLSEFVALHVVALLDPIVRSGDADGILIRPGRRPILMLQLARLLQNSQCQQLVCSVLGISRQKKWISNV